MCEVGSIRIQDLLKGLCPEDMVNLVKECNLSPPHGLTLDKFINKLGSLKECGVAIIYSNPKYTEENNLKYYVNQLVIQGVVRLDKESLQHLLTVTGVCKDEEYFNID